MGRGVWVRTVCKMCVEGDITVRVCVCVCVRECEDGVGGRVVGMVRV